MDISNTITVIVFRIAISIAVGGLSAIFFFIPGLLRDKSQSYFRYLCFLCSGISIGLSMLSLPLEAIFYLGGNYVVVFLLMSLSFLVLIVFEVLAAGGLTSFTSSFSSNYTYDTLSHDEESDSILEEFNDNQIEMVQTGDTNTTTNNNNDDIEGNAISSSPTNRINNTRYNASTAGLKRHFPSIILVVTVVYACLDGFTMGSHEHAEYGNMIRLITQKAVIALVLATFLEFLEAPMKYFMTFLISFSLAAPAGILIGSLVSDNNDVIISILYGISAAVCSGVLLYLGATQILPAGVVSVQSHPEESPGQLAALAVGFVLTILPSLVLDYELGH